MDPSPLVLILATTLMVPVGPAVDNSSVHRAVDVRRLERTKSWLREHWALQMKVLADSQSCLTQARGWGEIGLCARLAQQRVRAVEAIQTSSCGAPDGMAGLASAPNP